MTYITESQFEKQYKPHLQENGDLFEFEDVKDLPIHKVWTIVEDGGETENWYAEPGFHIVNVMGYCWTEKPWTDKTEDAVWFFDTRIFIDFTCENCHEEVRTRVEDFDDNVECPECEHTVHAEVYLGPGELEKLQRAHFAEFGEVYTR